VYFDISKEDIVIVRSYVPRLNILTIIDMLQPNIILEQLTFIKE